MVRGCVPYEHPGLDQGGFECPARILENPHCLSVFGILRFPTLLL